MTISRLRWLAAVVLALLPAAPAVAVAQTQQSGPTLDVRVGIRGWVDPDVPTAAIVDVSSPELFSGRLEIAGSRTVSTPVEVPAGGAKRYVVDLPAIGRNLRVLVSLIPDGEGAKAVATQRVTLSAPSREVLVGVLGVDGILPALRAATTTPTARAISPIELESTDLAAGGDPLGYLIVGAGAFDAVDAATLARLESWIEDGGRLFGPPSEVERFGPAGGELLPGSTALVRRLGNGEVGVLEDPAIVDDAVWSTIIRDVEPRGLILDYSKEELPFQLFSAATAGREASVPGLPWLLGGILVFGVLIGPVNFLVLRNMGRPESAWLTVPALSLIFVVAFWLIGREASVELTMTHAAVIAEERGATEGVGAVTLQTSLGGKKVVDLPEGWRAIPLPQQGPVGTVEIVQAGGDGGDRVGFQLEDLGLGAVQVDWLEESSIGIDADVSRTEVGVSASITNNTEWEFWAWGIVVGGRGTLAESQLAPGDQATQTAAASRVGIDISYEPVVSEAVFRRGFPIGLEGPETRYETVYGLGRYGEELADLRGGGVYFFGFTDTVAFEFTVDGTRISSEGRALVIKELAPPGAAVTGRVRPQFIQATGAASIEGYYAEVYAWGAREVYLRYLLPVDFPAIGSIKPGFTQFDVSELWNWQSASWVEHEWSDDIDLDRYASPTGEVMLRVGFSEDRGRDNLEESIQLDRYSLQLGSA